MTWVAFHCGTKRWTHPDWVQERTHLSGAVMQAGSFVVETGVPQTNAPQTLLAHMRHVPWAGAFSIKRLAGQGIVLNISQGPDAFETCVPLDKNSQSENLRLTVSFDAITRRGRLAVEQPGSDWLVVRDTPPLPPVLWEDAVTLVNEAWLTGRDGFVALSSETEPVGPMPSLMPAAPVLTAHGEVPAGQLRRGDVVRTGQGELVPVLHTVTRRVPAIGSFAPVRLRAPYLGLRQDMLVAPWQNILIQGADVEYLFGHAQVRAPASALLGHCAVLHAAENNFIDYAQLILPEPDTINVNGAELESLSFGRLRRRPADVKATLLGNCPRSLMPEHRSRGLKSLKPFEVQALLRSRAA